LGSLLCHFAALLGGHRGQTPLPPILPPLRPYVETDFGWRQSTEHMSFNSILNFPQQAGCAELVRCACILLVDVGWGYALAAPHHDALYLHCESERAEMTEWNDGNERLDRLIGLHGWIKCPDSHMG
jgi:hypothetical protein